MFRTSGADFHADAFIVNGARYWQRDIGLVRIGLFGWYYQYGKALHRAHYPVGEGAGLLQSGRVSS